MEHSAEVVWQTSGTQMIPSHGGLCWGGVRNERRGGGGVPVNQGTRTMRLPRLAVHDFLKGTVVFRVLCSPGEDRGPGNALMQPSRLVLVLRGLRGSQL